MTQEKQLGLSAAQKSDNWRFDLPVWCVFMEAHANWFHSLLQPAMHRTLKALGEFHSTGHWLGD